MKTLAPRETSGPVVHPEFLHVDWPGGVYTLHKVHNECLDPLAEGAPDLGWEGDPRFCVYLDQEVGRYVFVRFEGDGEYRIQAVAPPFTIINGEMVNKLIVRLRGLDVRTGHPKDRVDAHNAKVRKELERQWDDRVENHVADKLRWALKKDKADSYA